MKVLCSTPKCVLTAYGISPYLLLNTVTSYNGIERTVDFFSIQKYSELF